MMPGFTVKWALGDRIATWDLRMLELSRVSWDILATDSRAGFSTGKTRVWVDLNTANYEQVGHREIQSAQNMSPATNCVLLNGFGIELLIQQGRQISKSS